MTPHPILFLADAHLRGPTDPRQVALGHFLGGLPPVPGGLVILGDLFEFLAGTNRVARAAYRPILSLLERWAPVHYIEGNHDFDLAAPLFEPGAVIIHSGPTTLRFGDLAFHLFHGDRTSPTDLGTRLLRGALQSAPVRFARDHLLPDRLIFNLALGFATLSRQRTWPGRAGEDRAARQQALIRLSRHQADVVAYAHTHMPHLERIGGGVIANPGPAVPGGSYLVLREQSLTLHRFPDGALLPPGPVSILRSRGTG